MRNLRRPGWPSRRTAAHQSRSRLSTGRARIAVTIATGLMVALGASGTAIAGTTSTHRDGPWHNHVKKPITLTVFSPGNRDVSGAAGVGFIVDLALDANQRHDNGLLSPAAGYKPYFNDPSSPSFHPGPDPGAPGLVVMLSSTPAMPGTPFAGARTNLAGLFQINGVAKVHGLAETWNTWQPGKALFGLDKSVTLTAYLLRGTAPAILPSHPHNIISNIVKVHFTIAG